MTFLTSYRKQQFTYIFLDLLSSLLVWVAFLGFRWLVHEGKVFSVDTILIPILDYVEWKVFGYKSDVKPYYKLFGKKIFEL